MKITKRGEYALKTLLAIAGKQSREALSLRQISRDEKLPIKFLEQIMMTLKQAGFVKSEKGKLGGYSLARAGNKITLGEIIRTIDGPLAPLETGEEIRKKIQKEDRYPALYTVLLDVRNSICEIIDKTTLADILERSAEMTRKKNPMYYI